MCNCYNYKKTNYHTLDRLDIVNNDINFYSTMDVIF